MKHLTNVEHIYFVDEENDILIVMAINHSWVEDCEPEMMNDYRNYATVALSGEDKFNLGTAVTILYARLRSWKESNKNGKPNLYKDCDKNNGGSNVVAVLRDLDIGKCGCMKLSLMRKKIKEIREEIASFQTIVV